MPIGLIFRGHLKDVSHPFVEMPGKFIGAGQGLEEIVGRQDQLNLEPADVIADMKHAFPQLDRGSFLAVENCIEVSAGHYCLPETITADVNAGFKMVPAVPIVDRRGI